MLTMTLYLPYKIVDRSPCKILSSNRTAATIELINDDAIGDSS